METEYPELTRRLLLSRKFIWFVGLVKKLNKRGKKLNNLPIPEQTIAKIIFLAIVLLGTKKIRDFLSNSSSRYKSALRNMRASF